MMPRSCAAASVSASGNISGVDQIAECLPLDELHNEEVDRSVVGVGGLQRMNRDDARVIQCREDLGFALEPCQSFCVGRELRR